MHIRVCGLAAPVDQLLEVAASPVEAKLDGALGRAQSFGDLPRGEAVHVLQDHSDALCMRKPGQGPGELILLRHVIENGGVRLGLRETKDPVGLVGEVTEPRLRAHVVEGGVRHDPVEPRLETRLAPEAPERAIYPQIGFLRHVLRLMPVADEPERQCVDLPACQLNEFLERPGLPAPAPPEEITIHHRDYRLDVLRARKVTRR